jgi:hypothetical protein
VIEPLGPEIQRELRRFGPAAGMAALIRAWPAAVGEGIAANAWPARFTRDGTLVAHAADSVWAFELTQQAEEIARRLGKLAPKGLKFVPGPLPEAGAEPVERRRPAPRAATAEEARRAASWAAEIADPELRELVARAARASLVAAGSGRGF